MPYVALFTDHQGPGLPIRDLAKDVRAIAYALNAMEGVGCRVVKQNIGGDIPRITIVVDGTTDVPWPQDQPPSSQVRQPYSWPIFSADTEGVAYVLAMKDTSHDSEIGWLPTTETCPQDTLA